jgi:hypothetical protein
MAVVETAQTVSVGPAPTGDLIGPQTAITALDNYIKAKVVKNGSAGRPHFVAEIAKERDPKEQILNIFEDVWLKNRQIRAVAKENKTNYLNIWRLLQDFEPYKAALVQYLQTTTRIKRFYHKKTDSSDFETVQNYIRRAHRDGLKKYPDNIYFAEKCYQFLGYKDPAKWTAEDVLRFLETKPGPSQSTYLDGIRQCAPQVAQRGGIEELKVGRFRDKRGSRKKEIFGAEYILIRECLNAKGLNKEKTRLDLHVTLAAREGSHGINSASGLSGLTWDRFKDGFRSVDLWESKVRGGIWWRDCPVDLFFQDLPDRLREWWTAEGKPTNTHLMTYDEIMNTYKTIRHTLAEYYKDKLDPNLYNQLTSLRPHDADRIHVNLLWEAKVSLEVVGGEYSGKGEGVGLVGRGWLDINVIKKYYLSLTKRSEGFQDVRKQIANYAKRFQDHAPDEPSAPLPAVA